MPFRYLVFYKPFNVLSQFTAGSTPPRTGHPDRRTLADFINVPGVYPVGRLDYDSEGLLLLTDDGALQHCLSNPKFEHLRTYCVQVEGIVSEPELHQLSQGVTIAGYRTKLAQASAISEPTLPPREPPIRVRKSIPTSWLQLTITEGRNRQVRRMTAAVGLPTLRLIRVSIGPVKLAPLQPGEWRDLSPGELRLLKINRR